MDVYLNPGQMLWKMCSANTSVNICSRRWGKSRIVAMRVKENVCEMPGLPGAFVASSFRQAHTRTIPSMFEALADLGWYRNVHYVVGHRPDKRLHFAEPIFMPDDLKDVVWFFNGAIMIILSQEVKLSSNSLTLYWGVGDEAKGLDADKLEDEFFPAVGGSSRYCNDPALYPHLWGCHWYSDMPATKEGLWLIKKYEKEYDEKLCKTIISMQWKIDRLKEQEPNTYNSRLIKEMTRDINRLRSKAVYYQERSIFDNILIVGADYVKRCERDLTSAVFTTSILCKRLTEVESKFYQDYSQTLHSYLANDNSKLDNYHKRSYDCMSDTDVQRDKPLAIAFDYNAMITCLVVAQVQGHTHKTLKSFYTKYSDRLRECIHLFCHYYQGHIDKTVIYYHNSTALSMSYVETGHDARSIVHEEFEKAGWRVVDKYMGNPVAHDTKFRTINDAFKGNGKLFPMFNKDNNVELLQAIPLTQIKLGENGFKKDKSGEKTPESESNLPLELRTDITDAWDDNFLGCTMLPYDDGNYVYA